MTNDIQKEEILSFRGLLSFTSQCSSKLNLVKLGSSLLDKPKEVTIALDAPTKLSFVLICNFCSYHLPQAAIYVKYSYNIFIKIKSHFLHLETDYVISYNQGTK